MQNRERTSVKFASIFSRAGNELIPLYAVIAMIVFYACTSSSASTVPQQASAPLLPVITVSNMPATTYQEYSASLEGSKNVEIRAQVDGYLDKILVDEGAYVRKGQLLFVINDRIYREQLNNARASLAAAEANLVNANINLDKLAPLVQNNVVSEVQLKTAKATQGAAQAAVSQAESMVQHAQINIGYTQIKAPVDGYIGRIPFKTGSLVGTGTNEALTVVSSIKQVYAYFSLSEKDFLQFEQQFDGKTIEEKIKHLPAVELMLADNSIYPLKGKVETVTGQFNNGIGAISFRAAFDNSEGLLRSGNTGRIRIPRQTTESIVIPQEATFELQDKIFVFLLADSNKVQSKPIDVVGRTSNYYIVGSGLSTGDKIVYNGLDRLRDGAVIQPQSLSSDSLLKLKPL